MRVVSATAPRTPPLIIEEDRRRAGRVATIATIAPIDKTYSYLVPDHLLDRLRPGQRVEVPIGPRATLQPAFCVAISDGPWDTTLREIAAIIDDQPLLDAKLLELGQWISRYYAAPLGHSLQAMLPAGVRRRVGTRAVRYARLVRQTIDKITPKQAAVLLALTSAGDSLPVDKLRRLAACGPAVVRSLESLGCIEVEIRYEPVAPETTHLDQLEPDFDIDVDQAHAIERMRSAVNAEAFRVQVLFGVTGSGKTECYIRAIRAAIAAGRQAILLVPEIALTTQTVQRLSRRFSRVAVLHSGLTDTQRSRLWPVIAAGQIDLVIGTRSAIFAPCPSLGIIVCDEEHEPSYKNIASPRYHTRDVAIKRAQLASIPIVLGSATPSLETWRNAHSQRHYELIRLPRRVKGLAMPRVHLVDMRDEHRARKGVHLLSRAMEVHLQAVLRKQEQAVLLLNRRGFASFLFCPVCNTPIVCPNCSVHMVFHATTGFAHCHYCHERIVVPGRCAMAGCGGHLVRFGIGTQRVEAELAEKFPQARVARLDSDAMKRPEDYARVLGEFEARKTDILIGTQMVAKGLDFPFVSFVGIVTADTALSLPDFRAAERTFQLVLQVSGRSGRSEIGGDVLVQTFASDLAVIRRAVRGDYEGFATAELASRRKTKMPPAVRLVRFVLSDPRLTRLEKAAADFATALAESFAKFGVAADIMQPQPCAIPRLRNSYRYDVLVRFATAREMLSGMDALRGAGAIKSRARSMIVDVDPVSLQ